MGSTVVWVVMMVVIGGSLVVAVLLLVLERVGIDSASFPSCFSLSSSSSLVETLISILSSFLVLFASSLSLSFLSLIGPPVLLVCYFVVWDIKTKVFGGEFVGLPTAFLIVVSDDEPETVFKVEFDGEERAVVIHKVPCFISNCFVYCGFKVFLRDVAASSSVEVYASFEDFLRSGRCREVQFNVTRRWLVAALGLSLLFLT